MKRTPYSLSSDDEVYTSTNMAAIINHIKWTILQSEKHTNYKKLLKETFEVIKSASRVSGIHLYTLDKKKRILILEEIGVFNKSYEKQRWNIDESSILAAHVIRTLEAVNFDLACQDPRFSEGLQAKDQMCVPVYSSDGTCIGVAELFRDTIDDSFTESDRKIVINALCWVGKNMIYPGSAAQNHQLMQYMDEILQAHKKFLLKCHQVISSRNLKDAIIVDIMENMKEVVHGSNIKIFLFEIEGEFTWPIEYCNAYESTDRLNKWLMGKNKRKIEFCKDMELAWYTVKEDVLINVIDNMSDSRLDRSVDFHYGFFVKNVISFPVKTKDKVIGAVNFINKTKGPYFTTTDEFLCYAMGEYFSFIVECIDIVAKLEKTRMKWEIAQGMLSYHLQPTSSYVEALVLAGKSSNPPDGLLRFSWYPFGYEDQLEQVAFLMMQSMTVEASAADRTTVAKFIVSSRRSYHPGCFHNFEHAVNVLHCVYNIYMRNLDEFSTLEVTGLAVAAIAHDFENCESTDFDSSQTASLAARFYDGFSMQHPKCQTLAVMIQDTGLFDQYEKDTYLKLLDLTMNIVVSTDIALGCENRLKIEEHLRKEEFDMGVPLHRIRFLRIVMSGAELSGQTKPFKVTKIITERQYEDFFKQGDISKKFGCCPVEHMDRESYSTIPEQQVMFLNIISKPIYKLLATFLPNTKPLLEGCLKVISNWKATYDAFEKEGEKTEKYSKK